MSSPTYLNFQMDKIHDHIHLIYIMMGMAIDLIMHHNI